MQKNMSKKLFLFIIAIMTAAIAIRADETRLSSATSTGPMTFLADSVMFRKDLTRVYGRLSGRPHTSNRIDLLLLRPAQGAQVESTDIDGVDMKRWFQWEDDGIITVEIDFPAMTPQPYMTISADGPRGMSVWKISNKQKSVKGAKKTKK